MENICMDRPQTAGEELANALSHGLGAFLAAVGAVFLIICGMGSGSALRLFSLTAYGVSLVLLYAASAAYHFVKDPQLKAKLRILDHCSIYLLILGTYIPMSLLVVGGRTGALLCLTNATLAAVGITLNAIDLQRFDRVSLALYALMGWLVVVAIRAIIRALPPLELALLAGGGVAYTAGIVFYKWDRRYMHFVWHLFVMAGSALQYACIVLCCL